MPVKSPSRSPNRADAVQNSAYHPDPRLHRQNRPCPNEESNIDIEQAKVSEWDKANPSEDTEMKVTTTENTIVNVMKMKTEDDVKPELKPDAPSLPFTWTMEEVENFFNGHGYQDEVDYIKKAEMDTEKLKPPSAPQPPFIDFSLKMGIRFLELIKILRKMSTTAPVGSTSSNNSNENPSSWFNSGSNNASSHQNEEKSKPNDDFWGSGGGKPSGFSSNSSFDFGSSNGNSGGRGRGGGGGGRACFKCNEPGHFARECPTGGGGGSGGSGRGGDNRACFKCNEIGHISRDCPNGGSGGSRNDGGGNRYYNRDSGGESTWGGGRGKHGNDDNDDGPSAKRPRPGGNWNSSGGSSYQSSSAAPIQEESWD